MSPKTLRRVWFGGLWLLLPWPMPVLGDPLVPAVRYAILAAAAAAIALVEGAAGPVGMLVGLFAGTAAFATLGCALLAWGAARLLAPLPPRLRRRITWLCLLAGLLVALALDPYRTAFGHAPRGGLLDVLS